MGEGLEAEREDVANASKTLAFMDVLRKAIGLAFAFAVCVMPVDAFADADKKLFNARGEVAYEKSGKTFDLAREASTQLSDKDIASTGDESQAHITLPDSSRVLLGSQTRVEMSFFKQSAIASAEFVVYNGRTRFKVEHPQGSKADYRFVTPTATIGVRGTEGDIGIDGDDLRVNVYSVGDSTLPVIVTFKDGRSVAVAAGQSLLARLVGGLVQTEIGRLTQGALDEFADFGLPASLDPRSLLDAATNGAVNAVAPGIRLPF